MKKKVNYNVISVRQAMDICYHVSFVYMYDYEEKTSMIATIIAIVLIFGVGVGGGLWYFFYREGRDPFNVQPLRQTTTTEESTTTQERKKEDINDDGAVTADDSQIVQAQIGCTQADDCWDDVIGKTLSGDNPIYVSDLDVNGDNKIDEVDVAQVNSSVGL